jgi:DNA-binding NtrC family response regulator
MRVLFVDDEPNILSGLRRILRGQRKEWDMSFVEGGQLALDVMDATPCEVIVSDMKMPGMDGAELLSQIQSKFPATIRIALSGETDSHMIYRCVKHAHQYLAKPCDADALISAVQRAFKLRDLVHDDKLGAIVADMTSLPSMPEQYEKIMQEMQSDDPSLQKKRSGKLSKPMLRCPPKSCSSLTLHFSGWRVIFRHPRKRRCILA